jgi:hypothetical protein
MHHAVVQCHYTSGEVDAITLARVKAGFILQIRDL